MGTIPSSELPIPSPVPACGFRHPLFHIMVAYFPGWALLADLAIQELA